jgi:hypothetical protein
MPNHVQNLLTLVNASEDEIKKFNELFHEEEDSDFISLNKIIPMPDSLRIESGSRSSNAEEILKAADPEQALADHLAKMREERHYTDEDCEEFKKFVEQVKYNLDNYGCPTWYDWCIKNWGTKWDTYDGGSNDCNSCNFYTAWSTPFPAMVALSKMLPDCEVEVEYADEDYGSNCGRYTLKNGEIKSSYLPDGEEALAFALDVWGEDYEEYMERLKEDEEEAEAEEG